MNNSRKTITQKEQPSRFTSKRPLVYLSWMVICLAIIGLGSGLFLTKQSVQASSQPIPQLPATQLADSAKQQIAALMAEKESRTPQQRKMDSTLIRAVKEHKGQVFASGVTTLRPLDIGMDRSGQLTLDIKGNITKTLVTQLESLGGKIIEYLPEMGFVQVKISIDQVETIANYPEVTFLRPKMKAMVNKAPVNSSFVGPVIPHHSTFAERAANVRNNLSNLLAEAQKKHIKPNIGSVTSQGDTVHRAAMARTMFGVAGAGIKIGVLSDSYNSTGGAGTDVTTGDLPGTGNPNGNTTPVTVVQDFVGGSDEGRAMLQIIHDIAPKAQLFFATAFVSEQGFANNILALRNAPNNCDIIIDDVFYFDESPFQDGIVAQAVNTVTTGGALYFSSAGNQGSLAKGTSSVWQGDFTDGGALTIPGNTKMGTVNNFTPGGTATIANVVTDFGSAYGMFWSDPLGGSSNDYDFFILNSTLTTVFDSGTTTQNGTQDPFEIGGGGPFPGDRVVIFKTTAAAQRAIHFNAFGAPLTVATNGQTHGHSCAVNAFGCAAAPTGPAVFNVVGPFPNPYSSTSLVEDFSSDGPRRVFYNANGTPITPGNVLFGTSGGSLRQKPDLTAADGVSTTLPGSSGLNPFFGTSAAAPHAGAIAALLKSGAPSLNNAQIRTFLTSSPGAIDIESSGFDNVSGAGVLDAFALLQAAGVTPQASLSLGTITVSDPTGNNNGIAEPGESATLSAMLSNIGAATATAISATLSSSTTGVTITTPTSAYPNISAPSGTATNTTPFAFSVANSVACGTTLNFTLTVTYSGGPSPAVFNFSRVAGVSGSPTSFEAVSPQIPLRIPPTGTGGSGISANDNTLSTIAVSGITGSISKVTVSFYATHTFDSDLTFSLTSPDNTTITLVQNRGGSGDNFGSSSANRTVLDDAAATAISAGTAPFVGTFRPESPLSAFSGKMANGTWTLRINDNAGGDTGTLINWGLQISAFTCGGGGGASIDHTSVFVADTTNNRIQRSDNDGSTWVTVGFGAGTGLGQFNAPRGVSSSANNMKVFVADTANNRVQRSLNGGTTWTLISGPGTALGGVVAPQGVAYDETSDILYIADTGNNRIVKVATASGTITTGSFSLLGTAGTAVGSFNQPRGIAVDATGKVYVADTSNSRVQMNTNGTPAGWVLFAGAAPGTGTGQMNLPSGIYVDNSGKVYVADTANNRIQVNSGGMAAGWTVFMPAGTALGSVNGPQGVTKASSGNVFIGDTLNNRIQKKPAAGGAAVLVGAPGTGVGTFNGPTGVR